MIDLLLESACGCAPVVTVKEDEEINEQNLLKAKTIIVRFGPLNVALGGDVKQACKHCAIYRRAGNGTNGETRFVEVPNTRERDTLRGQLARLLTKASRAYTVIANLPPQVLGPEQKALMVDLEQQIREARGALGV